MEEPPKCKRDTDTVEMNALNTNEAVRELLLENLKSDQGKFAQVAFTNDY